MPLQDDISPHDEERHDQVANFLQGRWHDVLDQDEVSDLKETMETNSWFAKTFRVIDSQIGDPIKVRFSFVVEGLNESGQPNGEVITGSAVAEIDEFDNVDFSHVEVEQQS